MSSSHLLSLLQLTDPALPIGGYAHSAGLETYVQKGIVHNLVTSKEFVISMLENNLQYTDAAFVSLAYDAMMAADFEKVVLLDDECAAIKLPSEIREASRKLGIRLLKIFEPVSDHPIITMYKESTLSGKAHGNYCIAFGLVAAALRTHKDEALTGFYYNAATSMITNCGKLVPLGQQEGQALLFSLQGMIEKLVTNSIIPDLTKIGYCCAGFDIRCMQHEELYSRVYMS